MATGTIKVKTNNPIKSKILSGVTINTGSYANVIDASLAGKNFQGYQIYSVAGKNISITQAYIGDSGFFIAICNNDSTSVTTGNIVVHYTD